MGETSSVPQSDSLFFLVVIDFFVCLFLSAECSRHSTDYKEGPGCVANNTEMVMAFLPVLLMTNPHEARLAIALGSTPDLFLE